MIRVGRALFLLAGACAAPAVAQRSGENATRQADDAFGISVGTEAIGLYNPGDVRNFNPLVAGNIRIEGLYFDQQVAPSERTAASSIIRVGINTLGYTFPAPSGVVDYNLRAAAARNTISVTTGVEGFLTPTLKVDTSLRSKDAKWSLAAGVGWQPRVNDYRGGSGKLLNVGLVPRWRPSDDVEIIAFYDHEISNLEVAPIYLPAGPSRIPRIDRGRFFGQDWAVTDRVSKNLGLIGKARFGGGLATRGGLFLSTYRPKRDAYDLYRGVTADGRADRVIFLVPEQKFRSLSGELQAEYEVIRGSTRHLLTIVGRGRRSDERYGGEVPFFFGADDVDVVRRLPEPDPTFLPQNRDEVRQVTAGVSYRLQAAAKFDAVLGLQKTNYRKASTDRAGSRSNVTDSPWLYNGLVAWRFNDKLVAYASYSRGLEESGVAPSAAANRGEVLPPLQTLQRELGFRTGVGPINVTATAFELKRPYAGLRPDGRFDFVGKIRNRGVEVSVTGRPVKGLSTVLGAVYLDPLIIGEQVDQGLIGKRPVTFARFALQGAIDYELPFARGASFDAQIGSFGKRTARRDNLADVPPRTLFNAGMRYRFKAFAKPTQLRFQVLNLFNNYGPTVGAGEEQSYNIQRRFRLLLTSDL